MLDVPTLLLDSKWGVLSGAAPAFPERKLIPKAANPLLRSVKAIEAAIQCRQFSKAAGIIDFLVSAPPCYGSQIWRAMRCRNSATLFLQEASPCKKLPGKCIAIATAPTIWPGPENPLPQSPRVYFLP